MNAFRGWRLVFLATLMQGCAQTMGVDKSSGREVVRTTSSFDVKQVAKSDIDRFADTYRRELFGSIRVLAEKLYRRHWQYSTPS